MNISRVSFIRTMLVGIVVLTLLGSGCLMIDDFTAPEDATVGEIITVEVVGEEMFGMETGPAFGAIAIQIPDGWSVISAYVKVIWDDGLPGPDATDFSVEGPL